MVCRCVLQPWSGAGQGGGLRRFAGKLETRATGLTDSKDIKDLYYKVEYQRDKANGPEAQLEKFIQSLDGGVWRCEHSNYNDSYLDTEVGHTYIVVSGHTISGECQNHC